MENKINVIIDEKLEVKNNFPKIYIHPFFNIIDIIINIFRLLIKGDSTFFQNFRFFPASLTGNEWSLFLSIGDHKILPAINRLVFYYILKCSNSYNNVNIMQT